MTISTASPARDDVFIGNSEMAQRMRAFDWCATPLGPPGTWPASLRMTLQVMLTSGFSMGLIWGPERLLLYNDAYRHLLGDRHPRALGQPVERIWPETWPMIEERLCRVYETRAGTWEKEHQLVLNRHGYPEETYHTFSYSPVIGERGQIEGVLTIVTDETSHIIYTRQGRALWELSSAIALASDRASVIAAAENTLRNYAQDLPFCLLYLFDGDGHASLAASTGLSPGHPLAPARLTGICPLPWIPERLRRAADVEVIDLCGLPDLPPAPCGVPPFRAAIVPLVGGETEHPAGALVVGLNPHRQPDRSYLEFLRLLADRIRAGLTGAAAYEAERRRAATLGEAARRRQQANLRLTSEMALRTQERDQLRLMFEQAPGFMCLLRADDFVYELANRAYEELVACRDLIGRSIPEALPHVVFGVHPETLMDSLRRGEAFTGRDIAVQVTRAEGQPPETRYVNVVFQPMHDADGHLTHIFIEGHDVTDRKRAEQQLQQLNETLEQRVARRTAELAETLEQLKRESEERAAAEAALRHAQKLESLGRLTGGIAHDFNNLLQVISGNLQLLAGCVAGNPRAERRIANALEGVARGSRLAAQLLAFARRQPLEPRVINVGRLILNMDDMLRRALGQAIQIKLHIAEDLGNTLVDPGQFENALLNLAINARDAMAGQGVLRIEAHNEEVEGDVARLHGEIRPGRYVTVSVTDTGTGIAPELLDRVFEPFFSTKSLDKGTGLGLSMVHGFVKQSGGHVRIVSQVGEGTTVRLYLPLFTQPEDEPADESVAAVRGGSETILVVEDDEKVREATVSLLRELGYRVLEAPDAARALDIIDSGAAINLLFSDVILPGPLRSPDLATIARKRLPGLRVLFTSGYTENVFVRNGRLAPDVELLPKPYTREVLARKIRHVLDSGERPRRSVLLVENDATIRAWTAEILSHLGYRVTEAGTAAFALAALESGPFDLLLADVTLPDTSGIELARMAQQRFPQLPLLFTSGGESVPPDAELGRCITLHKPYAPAELEQALARTIP